MTNMDYGCDLKFKLKLHSQNAAKGAIQRLRELLIWLSASSEPNKNKNNSSLILSFIEHELQNFW